MFYSVICLTLPYKSSFKIREPLLVKVLIDMYYIYICIYIYKVLKLVGRSRFVEMANTTESTVNAKLLICQGTSTA